MFSANTVGVWLDDTFDGTSVNTVRDNRLADNTARGVDVSGAGNVNSRILRNTFSAHADAIVDLGTGTVTTGNNCVPADPDC